VARDSTPDAGLFQSFKALAVIVQSSNMVIHIGSSGKGSTSFHSFENEQGGSYTIDIIIETCT